MTMAPAGRDSTMSKATLQALRDEFQAGYVGAAEAVCAAHRQQDQAALAETARHLSALVEDHNYRQVRDLVKVMKDLAPALGNWSNIPGKVTPRLARLAHLANLALQDVFDEYVKPQAEEAPEAGQLAKGQAEVCRAALQYGDRLRHQPNDTTGIQYALHRLLAVPPASTSPAPGSDGKQ
jgi:hypothetical protein